MTRLCDARLLFFFIADAVLTCRWSALTPTRCKQLAFAAASSGASCTWHAQRQKRAPNALSHIPTISLVENNPCHLLPRSALVGHERAKRRGGFSVHMRPGRKALPSQNLGQCSPLHEAPVRKVIFRNGERQTALPHGHKKRQFLLGHPTNTTEKQPYVIVCGLHSLIVGELP